MPAGSGPVLSLRRRGGAARVAVLAVVVLLAVRCVDHLTAVARSFAQEGDLAQAAAQDGPPSTAAPAAAGALGPTASQVVLVASVLACLAAAVLVLRWQARAVANQRPLGVPSPRYGRVAATLCWLVPVWNLVGPRQVLGDVWRAAAPEEAPIEPERSGDRERVPLVLSAWWGCWIAGFSLAVLGSRTPLQMPADRITIDGLQAASAAFACASGLGLVRVLRRVTARHERLAGTTTAGDPPG